MTVSSSTNKTIGNGNGVTTSWPFAFKIFDPGHLVVTYTNASGDETTLDPGQYVVTLNADQDASPGGTVTYSPAIAGGTKLTILRSVPYTQATDIKNQGGFFPEVLERAIDLVVMQVQQVREQLARAFKLSPSQSAIGELEATDANRANTYVGFDASGALALYTGVASGTAVSVAMAPVVSAASLSAGRTAMGVAGLGDNNTLTGTNTYSGPVTLSDDVTLSGDALPTLLAGLKAFLTPGHRLSLTTALAVTTADVTAAGTIYWTPWKHNLAPVYNGAAWILAAIPETSFVLDATNFLANTNYDTFLDYNAGTPRIICGPAWSSDTARTGAISRDATYGWWVNNASITCRISNNGGTVVKGAGTLLYLGSFRCAANGQTEDSAAKRFVWNMYNRVMRRLIVRDTTNSWGHNTNNVWRQTRNSATNQLEFLCGLDEDPVRAENMQSCIMASVGDVAYVSLGLDSATVPHVDASTPWAQTFAYATSLISTLTVLPGIGRHYVAGLDLNNVASSLTWYGDNGSTYVYHKLSAEVMA